MTTEPVSADKVSLRVSVDSVMSLPNGAVFTASGERTTLTISRSGRDIVATAETDSLQRIVARYEKMFRGKEYSTASNEVTKEVSNEAPALRKKASKIYLYVFIAGMVFGLMIKRMIKRILI